MVDEILNIDDFNTSGTIGNNINTISPPPETVKKFLKALQSSFTESMSTNKALRFLMEQKQIIRYCTHTKVGLQGDSRTAKQKITGGILPSFLKKINHQLILQQNNSWAYVIGMNSREMKYVVANVNDPNDYEIKTIPISRISQKFYGNTLSPLSESLRPKLMSVGNTFVFKSYSIGSPIIYNTTSI